MSELKLTPDQQRRVRELAERFGKGERIEEVLSDIIDAGASVVEEKLESMPGGVGAAWVESDPPRMMTKATSCRE